MNPFWCMPNYETYRVEQLLRSLEPNQSTVNDLRLS